jgi:hypothetical protein
VRWSEPIQAAYFWVFLAGMLWAALNIVQGRSRKLNVFCVCFGVATGFSGGEIVDRWSRL